MKSLLLRLAGPMQSWGTASRFTRRSTDLQPSKSAIVGLIAAAQGRRRVDPIEDLLGLGFAVRVDQPGRLERDFQTAHSLDGRTSMPLSTRYYLSDAVFIAAVCGEDSLMEALDQALRRPAFPLFLGRRSFPPAFPVSLGVRDADAFTSVRAEPWQARPWWRARTSSVPVHLEVWADRDLVPADWPNVAASTVRDAPLSFDPELRAYGWRETVRTYCSVPNESASNASESVASSVHDPLAALGGG